MNEIEQFINDWLECAGIDAQAYYENTLFGEMGPDGEDPLRNWKPLGFLNTPKDDNGQHTSG